MPSTRLKYVPQTHVFSARTAPARATMATTFIKPKATSRPISAQQQAKQKVPWYSPASKSRPRPW